MPVAAKKQKKPVPFFKKMGQNGTRGVFSSN
jgi:hypothetical protein